MIQRAVVCGGTGSLGQVLVRQLLSGAFGEVGSVLVFSRDEAKQHAMRLAFMDERAHTDEVIYDNFRRKLRFALGDVRNAARVHEVLAGATVVFYASALKQVPTCEYFPIEAVQTNVLGAKHVLDAAIERGVETVIGVSTDKAC